MQLVDKKFKQRIETIADSAPRIIGAFSILTQLLSWFTFFRKLNADIVLSRAVDFNTLIFSKLISQAFVVPVSNLK